jgi:TatD DNase family protein
MIETDSPYMTPEPHRGKRNEPVLVKYVAQRIAEIRGTTPEKIAEITTANAKMFFKLK